MRCLQVIAPVNSSPLADHVLKKKSVRVSLVSRVGNLGFFIGGMASIGAAAEARQTLPKAATSSERSIGPVVAPPVGATLPVVEPIINDEEFEKAVPPLPSGADPALDMPLVSIDEFERRLVAGSDNIALPSSDPELSRPLPPLGQFDVRGVELAANLIRHCRVVGRKTARVAGGRAVERSILSSIIQNTVRAWHGDDETCRVA